MSIFYDVAERNINSAIEILHNISSNTELEEKNKEIGARIINAIHSIVDYYERLDKSSLNGEEDLQFKAFSYVNNQIKHDPQLKVIYFPVCGSMFPLRFPMRFGPPGVCWNRFEDNGNKNARGKRQHYESCLCEKDVESTFCAILKIIENSHDQVINRQISEKLCDN